MKNFFEQTTIFQRRKEIVFTYIDNEIMLLHPDSGKYYSFNKVGAYIWELLSEPISYEKIIAELLIKFDVEKSQCESDTQNFLQSLLEKNMIEKKE